MRYRNGRRASIASAAEYADLFSTHRESSVLSPKFGEEVITANTQLSAESHWSRSPGPCVNPKLRANGQISIDYPRRPKTGGLNGGARGIRTLGATKPSSWPKDAQNCAVSGGLNYHQVSREDCRLPFGRCSQLGILASPRLIVAFGPTVQISAGAASRLPWAAATCAA